LASNLILPDPADLITGTTTLGGNTGTVVRLLVCHTCKSITPIPDHAGRGDDDMLVNRVMEHQFDPEHLGRDEMRLRPHEMLLCRAPEAIWNTHRKELIAEIHKHTVGAGEAEGLGVELYDVKSNFMEDAMKCWRFDHGRTSNCDDYMSEKKMLLPDSKAERKELGLDPADRPKQFLCQYCPYESLVQQRKNRKRGMYN
jgi:hypothetical protein